MQYKAAEISSLAALMLSIIGSTIIFFLFIDKSYLYATLVQKFLHKIELL